MKTVNYIGVAVGLISMGLGWFCFGWELPLVLFLAIAGNNMERIGRK